jgi:hypothetical protein
MRGQLCWIAIATLAVACTPPQTSLEQLSKATMLAADLRVQFTKAGDAANRAVMADTDETSVTFAHEAESATQATQKDSAALRPLLMALGYSQELQLLDQFDRQFADYRSLDNSVLSLAVENTNLKAQRLSFGPVHESAASFQAAVDAAAASATPADRWHAQTLAASAVAAVREIEVLQAPHIAESDDAAMTRMEASMAASEKEARGALTALSTLLAATSRSKVQPAAAALDQLVKLNEQLVALSRQNTNVKSLALSLGKKRMLTASCDDTLRALQDALAKRGFSATR